MGGKLKWLAGLAVFATLAGACGGGDGGNGNNNTILLSKDGGDGQTGTVGTPLAVQLRVHVAQGGSDKAGAEVMWNTNGNGTVDPTSSITSSGGFATTTWTLGTAAGAQAVDATYGGTFATFVATGLPGPAASFGKAAGDGQSAGINSVFGEPVTVQVTDQYGNGIDAVQVNWTVLSGPVTLAAGSSVTVPSGLAGVSVTAGPTVGAASVRATTAAVAGNADFSLNVTPTPVAVTIGDFFFLSVHNNSTNPAVDTAKVGTPVIWTVSAGSHSVESTGTPNFTSSDVLNTGQKYTIIFPAAGTYQYRCSVHPAQMTGRVVVTP
jgi:plastocyanin